MSSRAERRWKECCGTEGLHEPQCAPHDQLNASADDWGTGQARRQARPDVNGANEESCRPSGGIPFRIDATTVHDRMNARSRPPGWLLPIGLPVGAAIVVAAVVLTLHTMARFMTDLDIGCC